MTDTSLPDADPTGEPLTLTLPDDSGSARLDKALAALTEEHSISRSRLRALIEGGDVRLPDGTPLTNPSQKVRGGETVQIIVPPPLPATPEAEAIPLEVIFEDEHLIVINKPVGMVVHPAPGAWSGTLVNALLHHCADSLSGIGGEKRPGIVHRIDKDTSGLLVVAKSDQAHNGLAVQFAAHDLEREYKALAWGTPSSANARLAGLPSVSFEPGWVRIETTIGRSRSDRKKMAVNIKDGRRAVTRFTVEEQLGPLTQISCRLETGRTHQIRVHLAHVGHPLVGDKTYGRSRVPPASLPDDVRNALADFPRQALHAATLGFVHPVTGEDVRFESAPPEDYQTLKALFIDI